MDVVLNKIKCLLSGKVDNFEIIGVVDEKFVNMIMNMLGTDFDWLTRVVIFLKENPLTVERVVLLKLRKSVRITLRNTKKRRESVDKMKSEGKRSADCEKIR